MGAVGVIILFLLIIIVVVGFWWWAVSSDAAYQSEMTAKGCWQVGGGDRVQTWACPPNVEP